MKYNANKVLLGLAKKFTSLAKRNFKDRVVSIALFGSVARGEANEHSDIDLLMIFEDLPAGRLRRNRLIDSLEETLEKDIDALRSCGIFSRFNCLLKTRDEARYTRPLYLDLTEDAVYLYDKGNFLKRTIADLKKKMKALGSRRNKNGSIRYWELKPDIEPGEVIEI